VQLPERFLNQRALDDPLWLRSLRFAISVLTPPGVCWALHYDQGIVFALVPSIASFSTDPGGPPLSRLIWAAGGGMAFVAGNVAGGLVPNGAESAALFAAAGAIYAFSESSHQLVVTIARFLCFGMAIGAFYAHATLLDVAIVASAVAFVFLVSLAADLLRGGLRASTAPTLREFIDGIEARETERLVFAASAAIAVALAYAAAATFHLSRPYWTFIALLLVLRLDFMSSWNLVIQRIAGTICGVIVAGLVVVLFPSRARAGGSDADCRAPALAGAAAAQYAWRCRTHCLCHAAHRSRREHAAGGAALSRRTPARHDHRLPVRAYRPLIDLDGDDDHPQERLAHRKRRPLNRTNEAPI
jgi:hypothetical protein